MLDPTLDPRDILPDAPDHAVVPPEAVSGARNDEEGVWQAVNLSPWEYGRIVEGLGRAPNGLELELFGVMWSEHCSYKNSRALLGRLPVTGARIVQGPGENAGAIRVGRHTVVFKIESHNSPSAVAPFDGAATGVGGILRDVFTMGARPVAVMDSLRFGPADEPRQQQLLDGVSAGIAAYAMGMGVPNVGSDVGWQEGYARNPLVNALAVGVAQGPLAQGAALGPGNKVLVFGRPTGRDGVRSATFSSKALPGDGGNDGPGGRTKDVPLIPQGDPVLGKRVMEATLALLATGAVVGIQDMGAAGFTSSASEMAAKAGTGIDIDVALVPKADETIEPFEVMLSETQERMLAVVAADQEDTVRAVLDEHDVTYGFCGVVTDDGLMRVRDGRTVLAEVPARLLAEEAPCYVRPLVPPRADGAAPAGDPVPGGPVSDDPTSEDPAPDDPIPDGDRASDPFPDGHPTSVAQTGRPVEPPRGVPPQEDFLRAVLIGSDAADYSEQWNPILLAMLSSPNLGDRTPLRIRYGGEAKGIPGAAIVDLDTGGDLREEGGPSESALAVALYGNGRWSAVDPYVGAQLSVAAAARMVAATGAEPVAITNGLNFGSPENPTVYWQMERTITGIADACRALGTPVTGGNVSLYNETDGTPIAPTPIIGMVGVLPAAASALPQGFQRAGNAVLLLGVTRAGLGGSEYAAWKTTRQARPGPGATADGADFDRLPAIDLAREKQLYDVVRKLAETGLPVAAHPVTDGGLAVALAHMALAAAPGADGCHITLEDPVGLDTALFGESPSRIVMEAPIHGANAIVGAATAAGVSCMILGRVAEGSLRFVDGQGATVIDMPTETARRAWEEAIPFPWTEG